MAQRYDPPGRSGAPLGNPGDGDCPYVWIGEWLCEYVDGTMDPSMQAVFEEYLEANPELEAHVERLCRTRALLSECGCRDADDHAQEQLLDAARSVSASSFALPPDDPSRADAAAGDDDRNDEPLTTPLGKGGVVAVASAMTLMLGVGIVTGALLFAPTAPSTITSAPAAPQEQRVSAPDRPPAPPRSLQGHPATAGAQSTPPWATGFVPMLSDFSSAAGDTAQAVVLRPLAQQTSLDQ